MSDRDDLDFLFGEQPVEEHESPWERREKFKASWIPETSIELEEMVKESEIQNLKEDTEDLPSIWIISEGFKSYASPSTVSFK